MKVGIVGSGMVGSSAGYALVMTGIASEVVFLDCDDKMAEAQAQDILHAAPFTHGARVKAGTWPDLKAADVVVIAAGVGQKVGETRLELLGRNRDIFADIIPKILAEAPDSLLLIATNPVDIMTEIAASLSQLPPGRVIGSGTILDSARFRSLLSEHLNICSQSINAPVLGEHGDSEVLAWSFTSVAGVPVDDVACQVGRDLTDSIKGRIDTAVRQAAYRIIEGKGATWFGIGGGIARIVQAIQADERTLLTVSCPGTVIEGVGPISLSLPRIVGRNGVSDTIKPVLSRHEQDLLRASANTLVQALNGVL